MSTVELVEIGRIYTDGGTQIRATLYDEATLADYLEALEAGATFPPVELVDDGKKLWLVDGFHRHAAHLRAHRTIIDAHIVKGTLADAQWAACAANARNGLRRTPADKRSAIKAALAHPKHGRLSDRAIAKHVGVGDQLVATVRASIAAASPQVRDPARDTAPRRGLDGKAYPAPPPRPAVPPRQQSRIADADREAFDDDPPPPPDAAFDDPAPSSALLDEAGVVVPAGLEATWRAHLALCDASGAAAKALHDQAAHHRGRLTRMQAESGDRHVIAHAVVNGWAFGQAAAAARIALEELRPHAVCPECAGKGCKYCAGAGWLSTQRWEQRSRGNKARSGG